MEKQINKTIVEVLHGYNSAPNSFKVENYPWGFKLRCTIFYWIETTKHGDRFCSYTIDPRTNRPCKPKKSTYLPFVYMYKNSDGHVVYSGIGLDSPDYLKDNFKFLAETIGFVNLNEQQKENIRAKVLQTHIGNSIFIVARYNDDRKELYRTWARATAKHIAAAPFEEIGNFETAPEPDMAR